MSYNGETVALEILQQLTSGISFDIPVVDLNDGTFDLPVTTDSDLYKEQPKLTNADLTTKTIDGTGTFDVLMSSVVAHLKVELAANRITGAEYTKAYIAMVQASIGGAIQYLLGRDAAYWQARLAQTQAITARIGIETAKAQLVNTQIQALTTKAAYALTVLKLATEDATFAAAKEQVEAQHAQTSNTKLDGTTPVAGTMGKQRDLYDQQITSYKRDAETKAAKMFLDAWVTQKTLDEGVLPPAAFTVTQIDGVFQDIKTNNNLG